VLRPLLVFAGVAIVISPGVVHDLVDRNRTFGGTLGYRNYLSSKVDLDLLVRDLTFPFSLIAAGAVLWAALALRQDRRLAPVLAVLVVVVAAAYAWVLHVPLNYTRMAYYLPLALVPIAAVAIWRVRRPRWGAPALALVLGGYLAAVSFAQGDNVKRFYSFANPASLRGLDAVTRTLRPGEVVVTDRCWSFLGTWLLHTRTLPALDPADIQPKAELPRARQAREVLSGSRRGRATAHQLGVRFAIVDPTCSDTRGRTATPPRVGRPVFVSRRLVVLQLR
jgi:hypothetical protein